MVIFDACTFGNRKLPLSSVAVTKVSLGDDINLTVTPEMGAFIESVTVPRTVRFWADTVIAQNKIKTRLKTDRFM
jgi:hypothetical protein